MQVVRRVSSRAALKAGKMNRSEDRDNRDDDEQLD